ncbi:MAG: hypothetical protein NZV14_08055 [Bryobacteraceae bacterium]|nr:hypothetical protein [Bryobacteraceae bacterium]MDW8378100.1 hypothetical protein [Bryobacterales bacterium]
MSEEKQQPETRGCVCEGLGMAISEFFRQLGPSEQVRSHFRAARVEVLKGLRVLLDERIQALSGSAAKGTKVNVD